MKILIGTNNNNKLRQFRNIFKDLNGNIELLTLADLNIKDDVEEDSDKLLENAEKKAKYYGEKSNIPTLADDTGLFIDSLGGEPGLHSKRWFSGTDKDRYMKILEKMKGVAEEKRTCHYAGALVFYNPTNKKIWRYEQNVDGIIATSPKEGEGFGYDPIVIIKNTGRYYSDFSEEEKAEISHRGLGIKELLKHLEI